MNYEPNQEVESTMDAIVSILFLLGLIIALIGMCALIPVVFAYGFPQGLTYLGLVMLFLSAALSRI